MEKIKNVLMAQRLLHCVYALFPIVAGLDKYFFYITDWTLYLSLMIPTTLGMAVEHVLMGVGVIEVMTGLLVLFRPKLGGYVVCAWLLLIAINLVSMGSYYDIALRDVGLAAGACALALLS